MKTCLCVCGADSEGEELMVGLKTHDLGVMSRAPV